MLNAKKICFFTCINDEKTYAESLLYIKNLNIPEGYEVATLCIKNTENVTKWYNQAMKYSDAKYKVYMHEDVFIINKNFISDFITIFEKAKNVGMIGIIGSKVIPTTGVWNQSQHKYGKVYDNSSGKLKLLQYKNVETEYESIKAIDSMLMITQYDIPWREDIFDNYYFYDISQCVEFNKEGYEVVIPKQDKPWCIHECKTVNIKERPEKYQNIFLDEYAKDIFPLVSIFLEACGRANYFKSSLDSIINQTYKNIEIIVIDGSLDNKCKEITELYLKKYPCIKYYTPTILFQNKNVSSQLLQICSGEYISYLTDDAIYHKDRINIMIDYFLEYEDVSFITSYRQFIDTEGKPLIDFNMNRKLFEKNSIVKDHAIFHFILKKTFDMINEITSPLFNRKIFEDIEKDIQKCKFGIYTEKQNKIISNLLVWISTIYKEKGIYLSDPLCYFKPHDMDEQRKVNTLIHQLLEYLISKDMNLN
ncbi:glycosyltransferase [Marinisporobacter balticus]|uniref:Glycosyl transferase family 2 n=1 Tax=Marinisporobacter balticus TaxID=2018667 RepID=A0A4R2KIE6_9FIRM|nr:glycosyltransferase [Marinisporobacter balticus]TCO73641.1 glycosyl transferase family 2 [Marinisporobacter balticus]